MSKFSNSRAVREYTSMAIDIFIGLLFYLWITYDLMFIGIMLIISFWFFCSIITLTGMTKIKHEVIEKNANRGELHRLIHSNGFRMWNHATDIAYAATWASQGWYATAALTLLKSLSDYTIEQAARDYEGLINGTTQ